MAVNVTVTDVQQYEVTIVLSDDEISENGGSTDVTATVDPASPTAFAVEVDVSTTNDYTVTGSTLFFAAGATESTGSVSIEAINNNVINDDVEVEVGGSVVPSALEGYSVEAATLTITDDEEPNPQVTLSLRPIRIDEGGTATLTVTLDKALDHPDDTDGTTAAVTVPTASITAVQLDAAGEPADAADVISARAITVGITEADGTTAASEVTFLTGQKTATQIVTLTAGNDDIWEGDLKFAVNATATVATEAGGDPIGTVSDADAVTLTVLENETLPSAPRSLTLTAGVVTGQLTAEWVSPSSWGSTHDGTDETALTTGTYQWRAYDATADNALEDDEGWATATSPQNITTFSQVTAVDDPDTDADERTVDTAVALVNGTEYTVEVRTVSSAGNGAVTTATGTPSAP
ncbi:MAG: hypothetical protein F4014_11035 [Gemmatimonadetes bacterium]|nr:hypothetical protein [Gemmatimonadota bacterium]